MVAQNAQVRDDERGQRPRVAAWRSISTGRADTSEYVRQAGIWERLETPDIPVGFRVAASFGAGSNVSGVIYFSGVQAIAFPDPRPGVVPTVNVTYVSENGGVSWASIPNGGVTDTALQVRAVRAGAAPTTSGSFFHVTLTY